MQKQTDGLCLVLAKMESLMILMYLLVGFQIVLLILQYKLFIKVYITVVEPILRLEFKFRIDMCMENE